MIESADQALYAAKALGRNRSIIFNREISAIFAPEGGGRGLDATHLATLLSLTEELDIRDAGTATHSRTVGRYCALIAAQLGMTAEHVERIEIAGRLHDIGKIGRAERRAAEAGARSGATELAQVRTHPEIGGEVLGGQRSRGPAQLGARPPRATGREGVPGRADATRRSRSRRRSSRSRTPTRR